MQNAWANASQFNFVTSSISANNQTDLSFSFVTPLLVQQKITTIAPSFYVEHLPFVCKTEWQMQKTVKLPLVFRLGDVNFVNFLEDKPNNTWGR